jgi:hypothetical protein
MSWLYESGAVTVTWNGLDLSSGWAEDTFLEIAPLSDRITATPGADGRFGYSKMANKGATITMTFQQTAPVNKKIAQIAAAQDALGGALQFSPFTVIDETGDSVHFLALNAVLTQVPTTTFGNAMGEKAWVWVCESYLQAEDPATITAALSDYIKSYA